MSTIESSLNADLVRPISNYGNPGVYNRSTMKWQLYEERFRAYLAVNRITDQIDQVNLLITTIGDDTYETLRDLIAPQRPFDATFDQLIDKLRSHFRPKTIKEFERSKLFTTNQNEQQSINEYLEELRKIANNCEYETEKDMRSSAILTAFINGLTNDEIRAKLVLQPNLTIEMAQTIAESITNSNNGSKKIAHCRKCNRWNHTDTNCWFQLDAKGGKRRRPINE